MAAVMCGAARPLHSPCLPQLSSSAGPRRRFYLGSARFVYQLLRFARDASAQELLRILHRFKGTYHDTRETDRYIDLNNMSEAFRSSYCYIVY